MVQVSVLNKAITATCVVGVAICAYAYFVETRKEQDPKYQAVCDLSEHMSCSRVLTSQYGKGFGLVRHILGEDSPLNVPNSIPGGAMFTVFGGLGLVQSAWSAKAQLGLGVVANIGSLYLGSILYFVLKDFCILCVASYTLNFINLALAFLRLRALTAGKPSKQKGQQKPQKGQQQKGKQHSEKQKSPQAEKKKQQQQGEKQKSPKADKQQQQQNGKVKNQEGKKQQQQQQQNGKVKNQQNKQNEKQKSPKTPNSKKKN